MTSREQMIEVVENALWAPFKSTFGSVGEAAEALHDAAVVAVDALLPDLEKTQVTDEMAERAEHVIRRCWSAPIPEDATVNDVARLALKAALNEPSNGPSLLQRELDRATDHANQAERLMHEASEREADVVYRLQDLETAVEEVLAAMDADDASSESGDTIEAALSRLRSIRDAK